MLLKLVFSLSRESVTARPRCSVSADIRRQDSSTPRVVSESSCSALICCVHQVVDIVLHGLTAHMQIFAFFIEFDNLWFYGLAFSYGIPTLQIMNISQFNYIESVLWFVISAILTTQTLRKSNSRYFKLLVVSSLTFFLFGISDVIEANTGAWWRPWWLLLLKIICVISLLGCFIWYRRINAGNPKG